MTGPVLELKLFGDLSVRSNGAILSLPQSKKTRALLAYLALNPGRQRRERLCELFWEIPDDPRGALRWSLSKLRPILNEGDTIRLSADREFVELVPTALQVDYLDIKSAVTNGLGHYPDDRLGTLLDFVSGPLLDGLYLAGQNDFENWRMAMQESARTFHSQILEELIVRQRNDPAACVSTLRALIQIDSYNAEAHARLIRTLSDMGRHKEAEEQRIRSAKVLAGVPGFMSGSLESALAEGGGARGPVVSQEVVPSSRNLVQDVRFCHARDGVRIAYAAVGEGPPLVKAANWMSHLDFELDSPIWRHWIEGLSRNRQLIRYDERGNGMSDRDTDDLSFEAMVTDLETVVDTLELERFPLFGISQGCAVSVEYAVRHPERVSCLILYGGFVKGWRKNNDPVEIAQREALTTLMATGWGKDNPAFRQVFTSRFVPGASVEQMDWFNELQRMTVSPENAVRFHETFGDIDVSHRLSQVTQPTLYLHARNDGETPLEVGRVFATGIPGAKFVTLDSENHILLDDEPAFARFLEEVDRFIEQNS